METKIEAQKLDLLKYLVGKLIENVLYVRLRKQFFIKAFYKISAFFAFP